MSKHSIAYIQNMIDMGIPSFSLPLLGLCQATLRKVFGEMRQKCETQIRNVAY